MGSRQPIFSFMGNPFHVCIHDCEYTVHLLCTCTQLHPAEGRKNLFIIIHTNSRMRVHFTDTLLFMPGCNADGADSVFQTNSWLCVNWKSTPSDLLCPLVWLVNLASTLRLLRYTLTACPRGCFRHGQASIFTFSQRPHYCAYHPPLPMCTK